MNKIAMLPVSLPFLLLAMGYGSENKVLLNTVLLDDDARIRRQPVQEDILERNKEPNKISQKLGKITPYLKKINGFLDSQYRFRATSSDDDHDLYETLGLDVGKELSFHFLGRAAVDLDGNQGKSSYAAFDSLADTYSKSIDAKLFSAYLDYNKLEKVDQLRLGRQTLYQTPEIAFFDGLNVESSELGRLKGQVGVYGGVPVHLYESSSSNDYIIGLNGSISPWWGSNARLDWMRVKDAYKTNLHENDLFNLGLKQKINDKVRLSAAYSLLESESRDLSLKGYYQDAEHDLQLYVSYYKLLNSQEDHAMEFNPYQAILRDMKPYCQVHFLASKGLGENLFIEAGVDVRTLDESGDKGTYNREYTRYYLSPAWYDNPWPGFSVGITGEIWDSEGRDIATYGLDLSHRCSEKLKVSLSSYFSLYKYDIYTDTERDDVQSYTLKCKYALRKNLKLRVSYDYEDDDYESYHIIKSGVQCHF
ncbi:MAG: hypothetical protein HQL32_04930 [Planctomycetes bacterium]|nr:hypothetical protein [Planctomycetota bacterium]